MLLDIWKKVVEVITGAAIGFTAVKMYKGELEEGAEFRDVMPVCYVDLVDEDVTEYAGGTLSVHTLVQLEIFIADKDFDEPKILEKVTAVVNLFDGTDLEVGDDNVKALYIRTSLHGYMSGIGKAYKITIGIN